jgi:hypothetical protein
MIQKILLGLVAAIALILVVAAFQSDTYRVERAVSIAASPTDLFPHLNDFRKAQVWSPWVKIDPAANYTFEGAASGVGAINTWSGNSEVGKGKQTIIASQPNELVRLKIEFFEPLAGVATTDFSLKAEGKGTRVTWSMVGDKNYLSKVMCLFMDMDKMIGPQFEKGLTNLKALAEASAKK